MKQPGLWQKKKEGVRFSYVNVYSDMLMEKIKEVC